MAAKNLMIPKTDEAIRFLIQMHYHGPHHLVAINEGAGVEARTFTSDEIEKMHSWIDARQGKSNLYFHVNALNVSVSHTKASKEDVAHATGLHVDVDDLDALERIRHYYPRPTAVIFSGGGYQAFWLLSEQTDGLDRVEQCNRKIANDLGGDNCHNIDRIMRVPGTINVPNKNKRSSGRTDTLAYIVPELTDWLRIYAIDTFVEASKEPGTELAIDIDKVCSNISIDALPDKLSSFTTSLIIHVMILNGRVDRPKHDTHQEVKPYSGLPATC